jgi:hypothetical protein
LDWIGLDWIGVEWSGLEGTSVAAYHLLIYNTIVFFKRNCRGLHPSCSPAFIEIAKKTVTTKTKETKAKRK